MATCFLTITSLREEHKVFSNKFGIYKNYLYLCGMIIKDKDLRDKYENCNKISWVHFPFIAGRSYPEISPGDLVTKVVDPETGENVYFVNGELYKDYGKR